MTRVLKTDKHRSSKKVLQEAAAVLKSGGLVAFPTETVYGLGADAFNENAVLKIFMAKKRPPDNPVIVHVSSMEMLNQVSTSVPRRAEKLIRELWPGPLTIVVPRSLKVPPVVSAGLETVAVRMPAHNVALGLIEHLGSPIAAPSANLSGRPSPTNAKDVYEDLNGSIDMIIDAGETFIGVESTVIQVSENRSVILRPGPIPLEILRKYLGDVEVHPSILSGGFEGVPASPGMKYRHYAPRADMIVVEGDDYEKKVAKIVETVEEYLKSGLKVGCMVSEETALRLPGQVMLEALAPRNRLDLVARRIYPALRSLDRMNPDIIVAEGFPEEGIGMAIQNRLRKAAGYRILKA
ncbi:MAG: threonylcarbamoyl-AMP synthase [Candidatus Brockarchaeota archaeon]|nr:threonylcarbamoyl-AMP synthase [Candidatus Brockarchaeota archaeon]